MRIYIYINIINDLGKTIVVAELYCFKEPNCNSFSVHDLFINPQGFALFTIYFIFSYTYFII